MSNHQMSDQGIELLMSIESFRGDPYDDQTGKVISNWVIGATIGYGHLISLQEWNEFGAGYRNGITQEQAKTLFLKDLAPFVEGVNAKVTASITQNQFDALVILAFNIGLANLATSSVLKLVNNPSSLTKYPNLEAAWKSRNKSQGKIMEGLNKRRNAEWNIYSGNVYAHW